MSPREFVCGLCGRTCLTDATPEEAKDLYRRRFGRDPDMAQLASVCTACNEWIYLPGGTQMNPLTIGIMPPWTVPGRTIETLKKELGVSP